MEITVRQLRRIIREETSRRGSRAPSGTPEEAAAYFADMDRRETERRWQTLSRRFPKTTSQVGRDAFDAEMQHRQEGAAGGGSSYGGPAEEFGTLLDLLEKK